MKIGIIGTGAMGIRYATEFSKLGHEVLCCSRRPKYKIRSDLAGIRNVKVADDGKEVSSQSDVIFYLVPTEAIGQAARENGPCTKRGALVSSGASVMTPASRAFLRYLPKDVNIVNWHWLFGPSVKEIKHYASAMVGVRCGKQALLSAEKLFRSVTPRVLSLPSSAAHDKIIADIQAVTHMAYESMGTAWMNAGFYPWEDAVYNCGIDRVKILMTLRLFSGKAHVYRGLALANPYAKRQTSQYARSAEELFRLMEEGKETEFRKRVYKARAFLLKKGRAGLIFKDDFARKYGLENRAGLRKPNSHLSLLAMADSWKTLGINPKRNAAMSTPPFQFRLAIVEYLFRDDPLLEESINTAFHNDKILVHDKSFRDSSREWAGIIQRSDSEGYERLFNKTKEFFKSRLKEGFMGSERLIEDFARLAARGQEQSEPTVR